MKNNVAVVTGSSTGIGRAIALRLAESGFDIIVHACQDSESASQVAEAIANKGRKSTVLLQDFSIVDQLDSFVRSCWDWQGGVTAWVNNAGADVLTGESASWDFATKLNAVLQVDVMATLLLSREIGRRMTTAFNQDRIRRSILNMGWDQAGQGMSGDSGEMFAASKGAVMACSRSLAQSLAPAVRVNCIAPGWIQTGWGQGASTEWQQRAEGESLLGRWGDPDDVASAADFLVSEAAEFINGQVVCVNGGFRFGQT